MQTGDSERELVIAKTQRYTAVIVSTPSGTQQFLPPELTPVIPSPPIVGHVMPAVVNDIYGSRSKPFGLVTEALDPLEPDDIYIPSGIPRPATRGAAGEVPAHPGGLMVVPQDVEGGAIRIAPKRVLAENNVCHDTDRGRTATAAFENYSVFEQ